MEEKKFGEKLSDFFAGKGFYIVLLLCAALIATSIWLTTDGSGTDVEPNGNETAGAVYAAPDAAAEHPGELPVMRVDREAARPRPTVSPVPTPSPAPTAAPTPAPKAAAASEPEPAAEAAVLPDVDYFIWPVNGALLRSHSADVLCFDATMADWRTHSGWDIAAARGERVLCTANGVVSAVYSDPALGTAVEVMHRGGLVSVYANLDPECPVSPGQQVAVGSVLGTVGRTALYEIGEQDHLHFAMRLNGQAADPADYLPAP